MAARSTSAGDGVASALELFDEPFLRRLRALSLVSRRVAAGHAHGSRRASGVGPGSEFADYREYSPGDDYRHVDWNVYARSERLLVRQQQREVELSIELLLDCSGSMGTGTPAKLRYAQQLTAALAYLGLRRFDRIAIHAVGAGVIAASAPARGPEALLSLLTFLRAQRAMGPTDLARAARELARRSQRRGLAILISDLHDPQGALRAIDVLRHARFEPQVLRLVDVAELEPALRGELTLRDAETGRERTLSITPELVARYTAARRREAEALARACIERQVPLHVIDTRIRPEDAVLRVLRRGGVVRG